MERVDYDCVIIGAGFAGLRVLIEARRRGLRARLIEAGSDVGGAWYWNRYPGARTDTESWAYCYSFDDVLLNEWTWTDRCPSQPQVQAYLAHVADRFELRGDIMFDTRVERAVRDEEANAWTVETDSGQTVSCRYLVAAAGLLSVALAPPYPGLSSFSGEWFQTARWPKEPVDFTGKRVAVIGTGSTGVQVIPQVAHTAKSLTVFQRTPNFVLPLRNYPLDEQQMRAIRTNYSALWEQARIQAAGHPMSPAGRLFDDVDLAEAGRILERFWEVGGFRFLYETFDDVFENQKCNEFVAEFVRSKIRAIVADPHTAEILVPKDHALGAKRPPFGTGYYETFNRDNVSVIDISHNPIEDVTESGLRLADGTQDDFDVIIFALGFDAVTGAFTAIDIRGRDEKSLADVWAEHARTNLGVTVRGFPNMFILGGPGFPFGNYPPVGEFQGVWVCDAMDHARANGNDVIEADEGAMQAWAAKMQESLDATVLGPTDSVRTWFLGSNVDGKTTEPLLYLGGVPAYFSELERVRQNGFVGLVNSDAKS